MDHHECKDGGLRGGGGFAVGDYLTDEAGGPPMQTGFQFGRPDWLVLVLPTRQSCPVHPGEAR